MNRDSDDRNNRSGISPAHWQGQPVPDNNEQYTQDVGFDRRGSGTARQFGRAGTYGARKNKQEQRPPRGPVLPDAMILGDVRAVLERSGLNIEGIMVSVHGGEVVLDGRVDVFNDKLAAEQVVANCRGVRRVRNQLESE